MGVYRILDAAYRVTQLDLISCWTLKGGILGLRWGSPSPEPATFLNKRAILQHLPADMTGEEPQNVDDVLFFMQRHRTIG